jgi:hypothetical protein
MAPLKVKSRVSSLTCVTVPRYCSTGSLCSMTRTTLNGFGLEPQWDFSTFRCQLPEKLAVCPAQTPSATERNVGTNHETVLMAGSSCVQVPAIEYSSRHRRGSGIFLDFAVPMRLSWTTRQSFEADSAGGPGLCRSR